MTGQLTFDSHVLRLLAAAVELVNGLTPGHSGGAAVEAPEGEARRQAAACAIPDDGGRDAATQADADHFADLAVRLRAVFEAAEAGNLDRAATLVNDLLRTTGARPRLDRIGEGWSLHFHGADDSLAVGWSAGCASALALALGSDLAGRLGVCAAPACDRVYVDTSRNARRRFCSSRCQSRVKAAAHRARTAS